MNVQQALVDDSTSYNNTTDLQRLRALACYVGYIGIATVFQERVPIREDFRRLAPVPRRSATDRIRELEKYRLNTRAPTRVSARSAEASTCPQWLPEQVGTPVDEGENLDLVLSTRARKLIREDRSKLLSQLDSAAELHPTDDWTIGQRVRFLLDNGETERSLAVAESCAGSRSWCLELQGLSLAAAGRLQDAERAFYASVVTQRVVPPGTCMDTTVRAVLSVSSRLKIHDWPCERIDSMADRLWWLSDPLWSVVGNERYVAHHARRTWLALRSSLEEDERYIWRRSAAGGGLAEVITRYGWPSHTFWGGTAIDNAISVVAMDSLNNQSEHPYTVKEYARDRVSLIPAFRAVESPFTAVDADWQWINPDSSSLNTWWPAEHMRLDYRLARLPEGQMILLRRDSGILISIAIDDPVQGLDPVPRALPRVVLLAGATRQATVRAADVPLDFGRSLRVSAELADEPVVVSLEVPNRNQNEPAHRRRFGLRPPPSLAHMGSTDVALSDLAFVLLPNFGAPPLLDTDSAMARLTGSLQLPRNVPLALYWESYGFLPSDTVEVQLSINRDDGSALRSIGSFFGVASAHRDSVGVRWREPALGRNTRERFASIPTISRGVAVDIRGLAPGSYVFSVQMTRPGGAVARAERRVQVLR